MATLLSRLGLLKWFSGFVAGHVKGWPWLPALGVLLLVCLYSHYLLASLPAPVTALYVPFLTVALAAARRPTWPR
jgi:DASS family divalent anion:Na+ symporter